MRATIAQGLTGGQAALLDRIGADVAEVLAELEGVTAGYGGEPALEDVSFRVQAGERIGVLGPNGGGKSTLFKVMLGVIEAERGKVDVRTRAGFVPQGDRSRLDYPVDALDVVLMGTLGSLPWWRRPVAPSAARRSGHSTSSA